MKTHRAHFLIFLFFATNTFSQKIDYSSIIIGTWLTMGSVMSSEIGSTTTSSFFKYEFVADRNVYYGANQFELGEKSPYVLDGNRIEMFGTKYTIQKYSAGEMRLSSTMKWGNVQHTVVLIKKEKYDSIWNFNAQGKDNRPIPLFAGEVHLYDYVFSDLPTTIEWYKRESLMILYEPSASFPIKDEVIRVNLTVDSIGSVIVNDIIRMPKVSKRKLHRIKRKIENTSGYWLPAMKNGLCKSMDLSLTFVKRGTHSMKLKSKAMEYYQKAYNAAERDDFRTSLHHITNAINIENNNFQFYLLLAGCHLQMKDIDKYCKALNKARELNPFIPMKNILSVDGESIEIQCEALKTIN